ncbi:MAG: hypothetical protein NW237_05315 [Cyanobacteriota bacterium]|nr:hypothetical protein [Cyanobacteriota bacterium]
MQTSLPTHAIWAKHQENIAASLAHRLQSAQASHNTQLISALQQEQEQLRLSQQAAPAMQWLAGLQQMWQRFCRALALDSELDVRIVVDSTGVSWWYARQPRTGETVYADTQSELLAWIEAHHWKD